MLLQQLREQEQCIKEYEKRLLHIQSAIVEHQNNVEHPILTSSIYDPLRNTAPRSRRLAEVAKVNFNFFKYVSMVFWKIKNFFLQIFSHLVWSNREANSVGYDIGTRHPSPVFSVLQNKTKCHWIGSNLWKVSKWYSNRFYAAFDISSGQIWRRKSKPEKK